MKILLWGCTYSTWIMHFIDDFLIKYNYEIWMLKKSNKREYIDFFEKKGVHLIECPKLVSDWYDGKVKGNFFKILYIHFLQIKTILKKESFDLINLHFVDYVDVIDVVILKYILKTKLILSYWGSDLFRIKDRTLSLMGVFARHADYVTLENGDLKNKFEKIYKWANKVNSETVLFGLSELDIIKEKQENQSIAEIRKKWGVPEQKRVIAIGHNGIPEQQHIKVLESLKRLESEIKDSIFLLLQMSYGGTEEYRKSVIAAVKNTECEYMVIDWFLTDEEVAELRIITDIFVHAQTTDAFSGSIGENLFSETLLINAKWLRYQEFKDYDFKYQEFENISEINQIIKKSLRQKVDVSGNRELMLQLKSWKYCAPKWEKVYRKVIDDCEESISYRG